jgi:opacity protein-like surface antigen
MRKIGIILAIAAALAFVALPAQAANTPGQMGISVLGGLALPLGELADEDLLDASMGWELGFSLDHQVAPSFVIGADVACFSMTPDIDVEGADYYVRTHLYGAHGRYLIPTGGSFVPYVQAGLGLYGRTLRIAANDFAYEYSKAAMGMNFGVGADVAVNPFMSFVVSGAYHHTFSEFNPENPDGDEMEILDDWKFISFNAGLTFHFTPVR